MKPFTLTASLLLTAGIALAQPATTPLFWPDKQGPTLNGLVAESEQDKLPVEWSEEKGVAWKTPLEDEGHSTP
ncbi:MAG: hypothetical protein RL693_56, partial [Verrucomicrobiota bacterium]